MTLEFNDRSSQQRFTEWGWPDFNALWQLEAQAVEPQNVRRGGWSSMVRFTAPDQSSYYMKRQENHDFRDRENRFRRTPTVVREWRTAASFATFGIGTATSICLGVDTSDTSRGLLVTRALDDHIALSTLLARPGLGAEDREALWQQLALKVRRIHEHGYRYNCLYAQHVMVKATAPLQWDFRFIDLEKATRVRGIRRATLSDLSQLERHTIDMTHRDRQIFWDYYFKDVDLRARRRILLALAKRSSVRGVEQYLSDCANGRRL